MKKVLALILMTLSCVFCFTGCDMISTDKNSYNNNSDFTWQETLLDDWYIEGDDIVFRLVLNTEKDVFEKVTYSINNAEEVKVSVIRGKVTDEKHDLGGKFYVDTGTEIIPADELGAGAYVIVFFAYNEDGDRVQVNAEPIVFQVAQK